MTREDCAYCCCTTFAYVTSYIRVLNLECPQRGVEMPISYRYTANYAPFGYSYSSFSAQRLHSRQHSLQTGLQVLDDSLSAQEKRAVVYHSNCT